MCGSVTNNQNRPVAQPAAQPPACEAQRSSPERQIQDAQRQQDSCAISPAAQRQSCEQQRIDAKENAINTLSTKDSCGLSREQMVQALNGAGVGGGALAKATDAEVKGAYDQMRDAAKTPGHHSLKLKLGGKKFKANMNVASDGKITDLNVKKVKHHHGGGIFGKIGDVLKGGLDLGKNLLGGAADFGKNLLGQLPLIGGLFGGGQGQGNGQGGGIAGLLGGLFG